MKTPWTPGKWERYSDYIVSDGWTGGKDYIAIVGDCVNWKANADLIALAPELAEAILEWDDNAEWHGGNEDWEMKLQAVADRLRQIKDMK